MLKALYFMMLHVLQRQSRRLFEGYSEFVWILLEKQRQSAPVRATCNRHRPLDASPFAHCGTISLCEAVTQLYRSLRSHPAPGMKASSNHTAFPQSVGCDNFASALSLETSS